MSLLWEVPDVYKRQPLIRIPATRGEETRIELRSPDPACNPYLALAICLAAGLDGIKNKIVPPDAMEGNMHLSLIHILQNRIRELREERGMNQDALAGLVGVSQQKISTVSYTHLHIRHNRH